MQIRYYGWSGVTLLHANTLVGFDLFGDTVTWKTLDQADTRLFCVTHGHPEHCGSLRSLLAAPEGRNYLASTHLVSSAPVVDYLTRGRTLPPDNGCRLADGESVAIGGVRVKTFSWKHMPLLPPGLRPKLEYATHLLSRPVDFVRIGLSGLTLPSQAPMLGFHLKFDDGTTVLNYAEGLHRLTDVRQVERTAHELAADILLCAVEPEDTESIPYWIEMLRPSRVFLYEAHRPWRECFDLPFVNLNDYARQLSDRCPEIEFGALVETGQVVTLRYG